MPRNIFISVLVVGMLAIGTARAQMKEDEGTTMTLHHLHMLMNHGLSMVTEGSNMVMLAYMDMSRTVDRTSLEHGKRMMERGSMLIERALTGPEMQELMEGRDSRSDIMTYTHELGEAMLEVVAILEGMDMSTIGVPEAMALHHIHIGLNHALEMAAEGSNMIMTGRLGIANAVDELIIEHGKAMREDAFAAHGEFKKGMSMIDLPTYEGDDESSLMQSTHRLAGASIRVMDLLVKMPFP